MRFLKNYVQKGDCLRLLLIYVVLLLLFTIRLVLYGLSWNVKRVIMEDKFMREFSHPGVGEIRAMSILLRD